MAGHTVTRAQLTEAVYQEVGLSRNESAELVESVIAEISDALERGEMVKISSFGSFAVRHKGQRVGRNPKTGQEVPISPRRVLVFRASHALKDQINDGSWPTQPAAGSAPRRAARSGAARRRPPEVSADEARSRRPGQRESACGVSHDQRGRRRARSAGACAALLGIEISAAEAAEARRRPAVLPAGGYRAAAPDPAVPVPGRLHDPRRAEAARARRRAARRRTGAAAQWCGGAVDLVRDSSRWPTRPSPQPHPRGRSCGRRSKRFAASCWRSRCCSTNSSHSDPILIITPAKAGAIAGMDLSLRRDYKQRCWRIRISRRYEQPIAWPRTSGYDRLPRQSRPGRSVAQPGSASAWGAEGREFESHRSDHSDLPTPLGGCPREQQWRQA